VQNVAHASVSVLVVRCRSSDCLALADWLDSVLGRDFFFKQRHLQSILERPTNSVWAIHADGEFSGLVIVYEGSILHNLYISPTVRQLGIGSAVLQHFRPKRIRSKTNMLAGDPTEFYLRNGYVIDQPDPSKPHIIDMVLPTSNNGHLSGGEPVDTSGQEVPIELPAGPVDAASNHVAAGPASSNHVILTLEQYNELATLKKNRDRIAAYRAKRKAEKSS